MLSHHDPFAVSWQRTETMHFGISYVEMTKNQEPWCCQSALLTRQNPASILSSHDTEYFIEPNLKEVVWCLTEKNAAYIMQEKWMRTLSMKYKLLANDQELLIKTMIFYSYAKPILANIPKKEREWSNSTFLYSLRTKISCSSKQSELFSLPFNGNMMEQRVWNHWR